MSTPYTREELNNMSDETLIDLINKRSERLYPWCLIGDDFDIAKKRLFEWSDSICLLDARYSVCDMELHISYFIAEINEDNIITKIESMFGLSS